MLMNELDGHTITDPAPMEHPSMTPTAQRPYRGVFPVAPTIFDDRGELDLAGQRRCIDFMIDAGSNGLCILANFSEQFVLTDAERESVMRAVLEHVAGRVPVIVTTTHFGSAICAARSRQAEAMGAAMVMVMPPYHGATFRVPEKGIYEFFQRVSDAVTIPVSTNASSRCRARMVNRIIVYPRHAGGHRRGNSIDRGQLRAVDVRDLRVGLN